MKKPNFKEAMDQILAALEGEDSGPLNYEVGQSY